MHEQKTERAAQAAAGARAAGAASSTAAELARWREVVSCADDLCREDSAAVLRALLRGERAVAEHRRAEHACARRWAAWAQEAQLLAERGRESRAEVRRLRGRCEEVGAAAGARRAGLWAELEAGVVGGDADGGGVEAEDPDGDCDEARRAARRVRERLEELLAAAVEAQAQIGAHEDEAARLAMKARQAEARLALSEAASREAEAGDAGGGDARGGGRAADVERIVDLEVENELLQWQLLGLEERARRAAAPPARQGLPARARAGQPALAPAAPSPAPTAAGPAAAEDAGQRNPAQPGSQQLEHAVPAPRAVGTQPPAPPTEAAAVPLADQDAGQRNPAQLGSQQLEHAVPAPRAVGTQPPAPPSEAAAVPLADQDVETASFSDGVLAAPPPPESEGGADPPLESSVQAAGEEGQGGAPESGPSAPEVQQRPGGSLSLQERLALPRDARRQLAREASAAAAEQAASSQPARARSRGPRPRHEATGSLGIFDQALGAGGTAAWGGNRWFEDG
ncbi:unnamed protein product, partial [Prorocentrum cordatum]